MSNVKPIEMLFLDQVLGMEGGYVLNFNDRTFASFFANELKVDIEDEAFSKNGGSKGRRLRTFLQTVDPAVAANALRAFWEYREAIRVNSEREEKIPNANARYFEIVHRLEAGSDLPRTDAIERFTPDLTLDELVASIERDTGANKPQVALDRLHTYCMKKFAHLLREHGSDVYDNDTLNARAGRYFNPLRRDARVRPISDKIMRSTVETLELFNKIRNDESLAHDNDLVDSAEARFIFDAIANLLRFLKGIEAQRFGK